MPLEFLDHGLTFNAACHRPDDRQRSDSRVAA